MPRDRPPRPPRPAGLNRDGPDLDATSPRAPSPPTPLVDDARVLAFAIERTRRKLEETGGTIPTGFWSSILRLVDEKSERVLDDARAWRRERGLSDLDDLIVGDPAD